MLIHRVRAIEERNKILVSDAQHDGKADGAPKRVASADPVPKLEHVCGIDAKIAYLFRVGRKRDEMFRDSRLVLGCFEKPFARRMSVGQRFLRRESFRRHDKKRRFRRKILQRFGDVGAVDIGNEMRVEPFLRVGFERLGHHDRTEIGAADTDVDKVGDRLARVTFPLSRADRVGECLHVLKHGVDFRHHVLAIDHDRAIGAVAQRNMEHGSVLGNVDLLSAEHFFCPAGDVAVDRQVAKQFQRLFGDAVLGKIKKEPLEFKREFLEAIRVLREEIAHLGVTRFGVVVFEILPGRRRCQAHNRSLANFSLRATGF